MGGDSLTDLPSPDRVGVIILCGGASTRMHGVDKTLVNLGGDPLVAHVVATFEACPAVGSIVLVASRQNHKGLADLCRLRGWDKLTHLEIGGDRRQDSVRQGLLALHECDWVVVHDGARPFVTAAMIEAGLKEAAITGAATAAVPATDTIKTVTDDGVVAETLDRKRLAVIQTPQVFRRDLLERAHDEYDLEVTDDAAMIEGMGGQVRVFKGSSSNMKVTTPGDLAVARALLTQGLAVLP